MNKKQNILSIAPLVPIPFGKSGIFSYLPEKDTETIPPGSVVSIPFGPRTVRGVVWNGPREDAPSSRHFRYKAIRKILSVSFLSKEQLALAEYLANESRVALGTALERFIPKILELTSISQPKNPKSLPASLTKKYRLTLEQRKATQKLLDSTSPLPLLFGPPASGKTFVMFELIRTLLMSDGQALVIVSDPAILIQEEIRYGKIFGTRRVAVFHAHLKESEASVLRENIQKGLTKIILGTRSTIFLPFRNLRLIVLDDADAPSYEAFGTTLTLSVRAITSKLAELHRAKFISASSTPSFASFFRAQETGSLVELLPFFEQKKSWHIVNLRLEQWKKKLSPISDELKYAIASAIERKHQIILFVSRSGMSAFSVCAECKNVVRCRICSRALSYQKDGEYRCAGCGDTFGATPSCPICGSIVLKQIGIGTERIERDLRRKFPDIRLVRYDKNTRQRKKTFLELREFVRGERDVLITTEQGIRGWDLPRVSLVAMIDADAILGMSRWDSDERALRAFLSLAGRIGRDSSNIGDIFLQTFHPENPLFEFLKQERIVEFFKTVEDDRRLFLYPPFGAVTQLVCRFSSEKKLREEVESVRNRFETEQKKLPRKTYIVVSEIVRKTRERRFEQRLTIRETIDPSGHASSISVFENIFCTLSHAWTIERNRV